MLIISPQSAFVNSKKTISAGFEKSKHKLQQFEFSRQMKMYPACGASIFKIALIPVQSTVVSAQLKIVIQIFFKIYHLALSFI